MKNEAHITANNIDKSLPLLSLFELRYQTKQISFWILAAVMAAYGVLITIDHLGEGISQLQSNSPYRLSYFISLTSSLSVIIISLLCINAFMRDNDSGFHQLVGHLKSIKQRQAKLLSVVVLAIAIVSLVTIGMAFGLLSPNLVGEIGEDKIAAFNLINYIKPWLVFVLPNSVLISLILSVFAFRIPFLFTLSRYS
jgi:ABC-2 type transport system permease protein